MTDGEGPPEGWLRGVALFGVAVVVAGVALFLALSHNKDEAPFNPVQAKVHLVGLRVEGSTVVGEVDVADLPAPDAEYELVVVDNRAHRVVPDLSTPAQAGRSDDIHLMWDAADNALHHQYDWQPDATDSALSFTPGAVTSLPFVVRLAKDSLPVNKLRSDLTLILALTHGSSRVYWSVKLD